MTMQVSILLRINNDGEEEQVSIFQDLVLTMEEAQSVSKKFVKENPHLQRLAGEITLRIEELMDAEFL